jgi:lipoprotein NlpI
MKSRVRDWVGQLTLVVSAVFLGGWAAEAHAQGDQAPLKEIQLAAGAFSRGTAPPDWARLAPVPTLGTDGKPLVQVLSDVHLRVAPTSAWLSNRVTQVNDAALLGTLGQVSLYFNPAFQQMSLHRVAIVRAGATIDLTNTVPIRFLQRETGLERGVYSGVITASMVLPDVRVGDALHLIYSVEGSNPIMGPLYSEGAQWDDQNLVRHRRVTLIAPQERQIAWRLVGGQKSGSAPQPVVQVEGGVRRSVFDGRNIAAVDLEPHMPVYSRPLRWLQFSEFAGWEDVGRWASGLFRVPDEMPAELDSVMSHLRSLPDDATRASEALRWVQDNVRYYSVALGESSHRPKPPAVVLGDRYGDCKDKSLLLVAMLRALGLDADVALASLRTGRAMSGMLPSPDLFDHAVVRVRLDKEDFYVDPTRTGQVGPLERMGQHMEESEVLLARADSMGPMVVKSALRAEIFRSSVKERFELDAFDAEANLEVEMTVNGLDAESYRAAWPRLDSVARRQWALNEYDKRYPGIEVVDGPELVDTPSENRVRVVTRYRIPKLLRDVEGDQVMNFAATALRGVVVVPDRITREYPVLVPSYPSTRYYQVQMRWPESVAVVRDPRVRTVDSRFFRARIETTFRGRDASRNVQFEALAPQVEPGDLPQLIEDVKQIEREVGSYFVVGRAEIKKSGVLGIGKESAMDKVRENLRKAVQGATRAIEGGHLGKDDLANALCTRAEAWSDLGEAAKGQEDAERAVKEAPGFARSWNCRGNLNFALGRFEASVSDHGKSLALGHDVSEAYYRRGISRYYMGQLALAAADFERAQVSRAGEADGLYVALWHAWTLRQLGQPLTSQLSKVAAAQPRGEWPRPALALHAGLLTPEQVLAEVNQKSGDDRYMTLAEAMFYIGQHHKANGSRAQADEAFRQSAAQGITVYIEHVAAGFELARPAQ